MVILEVDAGELDDEPEELYALADLLHVACGGHAGDEASMARVVEACKRLGTKVGAHPSYADREGFGRRAMNVTPEVLGAQIAAQCEALRRVAEGAGLAVFSVKPHGALYHRANDDEATARACLDGARRALGAVTVVASPHGGLERVARAMGLPFLREAFADRGVRADGSLVPRGEPGAMIVDPDAAAARALALAPAHDALCVHGDTDGAVAIARAVRAALGPRRG